MESPPFLGVSGGSSDDRDRSLFHDRPRAASSDAGFVTTVKTFAAELLFAGVDCVGPSFGSAAQRRFAHGETGMDDPRNPQTGGEEGIDEETSARPAQGNRKRRTEDGETVKHD
jgi:hypothetical protein